LAMDGYGLSRMSNGLIEIYNRCIKKQVIKNKKMKIKKKLVKSWLKIIKIILDFKSITT